MGILDGLFGGGGSDSLTDLYGDLLTDKQRAALRDQQMGQGLLRMAGAFADAGMPSRMPIPFGSAIGKAAQAFGGNQDEALKGIMTAAQIRELQAKAKIREQIFGPESQTKFDALLAAAGFKPPTAPAAPGAPPGLPAVPPPAIAASPAAAPVPLDAGGTVSGAPIPLDAPGPQTASPTLAEVPSYVGAIAPGWSLTPVPFPEGSQGRQRTIPSPSTPRAPGQQTGLLGGPDQVVGQPPPGQGILAQIAAMQQGGGPNGGGPFGGSDAVPFLQLASHINYGSTGALGNPSEAGWRNSNIVPVPAPGGATFNVHRAAAPDFAAFLQDLSGLGYKIDPKTSGGYNYRNIRGSNQLSEHAYGTAIDVNSNANLYTRDGRKVTDLPPEVGELAARHNLEWGGNWKDPVDTMHFQWRGPGGAELTPGGQDTVIPSGRGISPSMMRTVADTGAAAGGMPPLPGLPGAGGAPGAAAGNPAMNALLLELARRNAAAEMLGMGNPYGSMLQVLQGSPQYKGAIRGAEEEAALPYARPKAAETAAGQWPTDVGKIQYQGQVNATLKQLEQVGAARLDIVPNIPVPDGKGGTVERQGTREQAIMVAHGFDVPELGFKGIHGPMPGAPAAPAAGGAGGVPLAGKEQISEAQKARIGIDAQLAKEVGDQALQARRLLPLVDEALVLARKTPEGLAGPASTKIAELAAAFGVAPTPGQSNAEALVAINQRLIPLVREPGAQSNAEMDAYLASGPGLMLTADGRVKIAEMTKAIGRRAIEVAEVYRDTIGEPSSVRRAKLDALDKPLFTPEQRAAMETVSRPPASAGAARTPAGFANEPVATAPLPPPPPIDKAAYDKLPPGATYIGPDGVARTKR